MNRLPEEATCKNCPHWTRIKDALGECGVIHDDSVNTSAFIEIRGDDYYGCVGNLQTLYDFGCSRHPYWSKEE